MALFLVLDSSDGITTTKTKMIFSFDDAVRAPVPSAVSDRSTLDYLFVTPALQGIRGATNRNEGVRANVSMFSLVLAVPSVSAGFG